MWDECVKNNAIESRGGGKNVGRPAVLTSDFRPGQVSGYAKLGQGLFTVFIPQKNIQIHITRAYRHSVI